MIAASPAEWVSQAITRHLEVSSAVPVGPGLVEVRRENLSSFLLGVTSIPTVDHAIVMPFFQGKVRPKFIVNIPKEAIWTGQAIEALQHNSIAYGGMGDLRYAVSIDDPSSYVLREHIYVERRLRQHRCVTSVDRLFDCVWRVNRKNMSSLSIAISNEYDLTADHVRTTHSRYAPFRILFHTNSLGHASSEAVVVADELDIEIVASGEIFARIGR